MAAKKTASAKSASNKAKGPAFDLILRGGHVVDPAAKRDGLFDIGIKDGKIAQIAKSLSPDRGKKVTNVSGSYVLPGMIDTHAHIYRHVTGRFGLDADMCGVRSGVTTLVDQGGPSCMTLGGFRRYVADPAASRVVAFISAYLVGGMEGHLYPELHGPDQINVDHTVRVAVENRDIVKGIKAHGEIGGASRWGVEVIRLAKEISRQADIPIYVHLGQMWPTKDHKVMNADKVVREIVPLLDKGDILAHPFTRHPGGFISEKTGKIHPIVREAIDKGVRVDVGHGSHFSFKMAHMALEQGIIPYTLGADLHGYNVAMPAEDADDVKTSNPFFGVAPFSLTIAMTELLHLGMNFSDVVKMVTCNAADMIGMTDQVGTLAKGLDADISIIDLVPGKWVLSDNSGDQAIADEIVVPRFTLRSGRRYRPDSPILPPPIEAEEELQAA